MGVRNCFYRKKLFGQALGVSFILAFLSLLSQGVFASASTATSPISGDEFGIADSTPARYSNAATVRANTDDWAGATNPENQTDQLEEHSDAADDVIGVQPVASQPEENMNNSKSEHDEKIIFHANTPLTPPPENLVVAVNETSPSDISSTVDRENPDEKKTAPGPRTSSEGTIGKSLLFTAGGVAAVGVAIAAGGGSGSDSSSDPAASAPGQTSTNDTTVINLSNLVRIGDDEDYNANHPDHFQVSRPTGLSWSDTFNIDNVDNVKSAKFRYTVAASKVGNPVYVNGKFVEGLCNPGNMAWIKQECSMDITDFIHMGSNEIKIKCAIDPSDTETPYDDVELYNLRIELRH